MMSINVIGSSSKGNCYILSTSDTKIMLDCGVKNISNKIVGLDGILITHGHL